MLHDDHWVDFVKSNVPATETTMHFIKQAVNDYHVTVYNNEGAECFGYDRRAILPGDFLQNIWNNIFHVSCEHFIFDVDHVRVQLDLNSSRRDNGLYGPGWDALVNAVGLEEGQKIVFTNLENYRLSMVVMGGDGLGLTREDIYPTLLKRLQRKIQYRDINDNRLKQICNWPFHGDHVNEENVFYTPLCGYVSDAYRLTIPAKFCTATRVMHTYKKAYVVNRHIQYPMVVQMVVHKKKPLRNNHVVLKGNWRGFGMDCGFVEPKMMRVKLVRIIPEYIDGRQEQKILEVNVGDMMFFELVSGNLTSDDSMCFNVRKLE
ncbi:hypothetical protein Tco_0517099 [Tanacetum coccineum]